MVVWVDVDLTVCLIFLPLSASLLELLAYMFPENWVEYGYTSLQDCWTTTELDSVLSSGDKKDVVTSIINKIRSFGRGKIFGSPTPPRHHMKLIKRGPDQVIWECKDGSFGVN